jgi:hypothetical protein
MGRIKEWSIRGHLAVCFSQCDDGSWQSDDGKPLPPELVEEVKHTFRPPWDECFEMVIYFQSRGYYDPGVLSGPPERCYPPEGSDERLLDNITVNVWRDRPQGLPLGVAQRIFDFYQEQIDDVRLDFDDYDPRED